MQPGAQGAGLDQAEMRGGRSGPAGKWLARKRAGAAGGAKETATGFTPMEIEGNTAAPMQQAAQALQED